MSRTFQLSMTKTAGRLMCMAMSPPEKVARNTISLSLLLGCVILYTRGIQGPFQTLTPRKFRTVLLVALTQLILSVLLQVHDFSNIMKPLSNCPVDFLEAAMGVAYLVIYSQLAMCFLTRWSLSDWSEWYNPTTPLPVLGLTWIVFHMIEEVPSATIFVWYRLLDILIQLVYRNYEA